MSKKIANPSSPKAMNIVFSRPMWSETQPGPNQVPGPGNHITTTGRVTASYLRGREQGCVIIVIRWIRHAEPDVTCSADKRRQIVGQMRGCVVIGIVKRNNHRCYTIHEWNLARSQAFSKAYQIIADGGAVGGIRLKQKRPAVAVRDIGEYHGQTRLPVRLQRDGTESPKRGPHQRRRLSRDRGNVGHTVRE